MDFNENHPENKIGKRNFRIRETKKAKKGLKDDRT